jgi:Fe-S-cluster containining protein
LQDREEQARVELRALYGAVAADLRQRPGLSCALSGRCCRFGEADHRLYLTRLEFAEMVACGGLPRSGGDACPWLEGGRCANRAGRALACRTYFCSDEAAAAAVTERWHREIRCLHERHRLPYVYRPLDEHRNSAPSISSEES